MGKNSIKKVNNDNKEKVRYKATLLILLLIFIACMFAVSFTLSYFYGGSDNDINSLYAIMVNEDALRLNSNEVSLNVEERYQFYVIGNITGHFFTWESSDEGIAIVDQNGKIYTISAGIVKITVTRDDGEKADATIIVNDLLVFKNNYAFIRPGEKYQAEVSRRDGKPVGNLTWKSSDPSIATVDENGLIEGKKDGKVYITVKDEEGNESTLIVYVTTGNVQLSDNDIIIKQGDNYRLWANVVSSDGNGKPYRWESSDPQVATVDEEGLVTGVHPGTAIITVTTKQGYTDKCIVTVRENNPITLNEVRLTLEVGDKFDLFVVGNITDKNFNWSSSDTKIVKVDRNGRLEAISPGVVKIVVRDENGNKAACVVTVISTIKIDNPNNVIAIGETKPIVINPKKSDSYKFVSSNPEVVKVDENGNMTGVSEGEAVITVYDNNGGKSVVTVKVIGSHIKLNEDSIGLNVLDEYQFDYDILDSIPNKEVTWKTSNPEIVKIDENGKAVALKPGVATITVYAKDGSSDDCEVTVFDPNNGIRLSDNKITMDIGDIHKLVVLGNISGKRFTWETTDSKIVSVDKGTLKAIAAGSVVISVKDQFGNKAICTVIVKNNGIKFADDNINVKVGETTKVKVIGGDGKEKYTSSNPAVATVDNNGNITGISEGITTITVTDQDGNDDVIVVKVIDGNIVISDDKAKLDVGDKFQLDADSLTSLGDEPIIWTSSDPTVAVVDQDGLVVATGDGTATITATNPNGDQITCEITVKDPNNNDKLELNQNYVSLDIGETHQILVLGDLTNRTFTYTTSDSSIATVDNNGKITAVGDGTAIIKVKDNNGNTANVVVYINNDKLKFDKDDITLKVGESYELNVTGNSGKVTYLSSDPSIVSVSSDGKLLAKEEGTVVITAVDSKGNMDTCVVKVINDDVVLTKDRINIYVGDKYQLDADVITSSGDTTNTLKWTSSNPDVASVSTNGLVTGLKEGTTTITVKNSSGKTDTCIVSVKSKFNIVFEYEEDNNGKGISMKEQFPLSDAEGINLNGDGKRYPFKIKVNKDAVGVEYTITATELEGNTLDGKYVKVYLESNGVALDGVTNGSGKVKKFTEYGNYNDNEKLLYSGIVTEADATKGYKEISIKMWIADDTEFTQELNNKTFKFKINVYGYKK